MRKVSLFVILMIALGAAGGMIRSIELKVAFNPQTQLLDGHYSTYLLVGVTLVSLLLAFLFARSSKDEGGRRAEDRTGIGWYITETLSCAALAVSGVLSLLEYLENNRFSLLIFSLFTFLSVFSLLVSLLAVKAGKLSPKYGLYWVIPIFWACFALILDFWDHAGNPVLSSYFYNMAALIFSTLFLSALAGFFFNRLRMARALFYGSGAIFFSVTALVGSLVYRFSGGDMGLTAAEMSDAKIFQMLFFILHFSAMLVSAGKRRFVFPEEPAEESGDSGESAETSGSALGVESVMLDEAVTDEISEYEDE